MAIKHLRIGTKDEFDKIFKVSDYTLSRPGYITLLIRVDPAALSGSSHLEALVASERLAPLGCFRIEGPPTFPDHH